MLLKIKVQKIILLLFPIFSVLNAQEEKVTTEVDSLIDELFFADTLMDGLADESYNDFIYSSIDFNSNTFYAGRSIGSDGFNLVPQTTYLNTKGWSVNLSGVYLDGVQPAWDVTSLSVGYSKTLGQQKRNVGLYANYSRYFFSFDSTNLFSNGVTLGATYQSDDNKFFAMSSGNLFFGGTSLKQSVSSVMYSFLIFKKSTQKNAKTSERMWVSSVGKIRRKPFEFTKNLTLKFNPKVTFLVNQETIVTSNFNPETEGFPTKSAVLSQQTLFRLTNTQIKLPLVMEFENLDIEAAYYQNLPSPIGNETDLNPSNFFGISVGYFFGL